MGDMESEAAHVRPTQVKLMWDVAGRPPTDRRRPTPPRQQSTHFKSRPCVDIRTHLAQRRPPRPAKAPPGECEAVAGSEGLGLRPSLPCFHCTPELARAARGAPTHSQTWSQPAAPPAPAPRPHPHQPWRHAATTTPTSPVGAPMPMLPRLLPARPRPHPHLRTPCHTPGRTAWPTPSRNR